ncbi:hypothetical protein PV11_09767 [Exophiala sideris]|uniref:Enoyl-CoA hydratase n=1 Tax=Exophiala sideris TaxID=1016849 RepID=A0A0D1YB62_9EURO|nr:hypothetical protein PV11_09767 [Exophiala sideris]
MQLLWPITGLLALLSAVDGRVIASKRSFLPWERDSSTGFGTLTTQSSSNGSVLRVVINNPPLNTYDNKLNNDMNDFLLSLVPANITVAAPPPKVVIFTSAVAEFWMGSYDINLLLPSADPFDTNQTQTLFAQALNYPTLLRTLPTIFIAEINGRATGTGNEFLLQCDMSFAGPNALVGSVEVAIGGLQGDGGIQYLVRSVGMHRAAEYLLQSTAINATEAAAVGWVNRAYASEQELGTAVDAIASRIAIFDAGALNGTKTAIRAFGPSAEQSAQDIASVERLFPEEIQILPKYLELSENQTLNAFTLGMLRDVESVKELYE